MDVFMEHVSVHILDVEIKLNPAPQEAGHISPSHVRFDPFSCHPCVSECSLFDESGFRPRFFLMIKIIKIKNSNFENAIFFP